PEFASAMIAMSLLQFREFEEVRSKRNLSYAPSAGLRLRSTVPWGVLYVTAVDPNTTLRVMLGEAQRLRAEPPTEKEVTATKSVFLTDYLTQSEATDGQAAMLGEAELYGGDWRLARTLPERIRAVTPGAVQSFAVKYVRRLQTVVLGDPAKIDRALFTSF